MSIQLGKAYTASKLLNKDQCCELVKKMRNALSENLIELNDV
jgi:hypothetical protein